MTYDEFVRRLRAQANYETIYDDTEGREILVVRLISAFAFVNRLIQDEREAYIKAERTQSK